MATSTETPCEAFLAVTSAGAFHAVAMPESEPERELLCKLLALPETPPQREFQCDPLLLARVMARGWVRTCGHVDKAPDLSLEQLLPELLSRLSDQGRALLADPQGLVIGHVGFRESEIPLLAALSAEAVALGHRARQLIHGRDQQLPAAWGMVDAAGNSRIGIWPLFSPDRQFTLVVEGRPLFVRAAFSQLIWTLVRRYGGPVSPSPA